MDFDQRIPSVSGRMQQASICQKDADMSSGTEERMTTNLDQRNRCLNLHPGGVFCPSRIASKHEHDISGVWVTRIGHLDGVKKRQGLGWLECRIL